MAVVQNSFSRIWPIFAKKKKKKRIPLASCFVRLSRSLLSHVGPLGVSPWILTLEGHTRRFKHLRATLQKLGSMSRMLLPHLSIVNDNTAHLARNV